MASYLSLGPSALAAVCAQVPTMPPAHASALLERTASGRPAVDGTASMVLLQSQHLAAIGQQSAFGPRTQGLGSDAINGFMATFNGCTAMLVDPKSVSASGVPPRGRPV